MKGKEMQDTGTAAQVSSELEQAQALNELRVRIYTAKGGFMALGTTYYMPFIESQAAREGIALDPVEKNRLRQVMNGNLSLDDLSWVELVERALQFQQAA